MKCANPFEINATCIQYTRVADVGRLFGIQIFAGQQCDHFYVVDVVRVIGLDVIAELSNLNEC